MHLPLSQYTIRGNSLALFGDLICNCSKSMANEVEKFLEIIISCITPEGENITTNAKLDNWTMFI